MTLGQKDMEGIVQVLKGVTEKAKNKPLGY